MSILCVHLGYLMLQVTSCSKFPCWRMFLRLQESFWCWLSPQEALLAQRMDFDCALGRMGPQVYQNIVHSEKETTQGVTLVISHSIDYAFFDYRLYHPSGVYDCGSLYCTRLGFGARAGSPNQCRGGDHVCYSSNTRFQVLVLEYFGH